MSANTDVDQGTKFGTWDDPVSRFMYHESAVDYVPRMNIDPEWTVADYGGANGLMKQYLPNRVVTIDSDASKEPDVVANILNHHQHYDAIFCRYVMHYLSDAKVRWLAKQMRKRSKRAFVVQFTNEWTNRTIKIENSVGEGDKYFRSYNQLVDLLGDVDRLYRKDYIVTEEFYANRLGLSGAKEHAESLNVFELV